MDEEVKDSRREALKKVGKAAAFVIPTMVTFQVSKLAVAASGTGKINVHVAFPE